MKNYNLMNKILYFFICILLFYSTIFCQEPDVIESDIELWYIYFGLGYSKTFYPFEIEEMIDILKSQEGVSHMSLSIDFLGLYLPLAPKTIGGIILCGAADRYKSDEDKTQINQSLAGLSIIHFIGRDFGSGVFFRTDMGLAQISGDLSDKKEFGFGILVGGGWSFDLGGTRLILNANYAYRGVESGAYHTLDFSTGGLF